MKSRLYLSSLVTIVIVFIATIGTHYNELTGISETSANQLLSSREVFFGCAKSEVFRTSDMACYIPQGE